MDSLCMSCIFNPFSRQLYIFYKVANLYKWPTPNHAPKPTRHWGLDKSYKIVGVRSYLVNYAWIGSEITLAFYIILCCNSLWSASLYLNMLYK